MEDKYSSKHKMFAITITVILYQCIEYIPPTQVSFVNFKMTKVIISPMGESSILGLYKTPPQSLL